MDVLRSTDEHLRKLESLTSLVGEVRDAVQALARAPEQEYLRELRELRRDNRDLVEQLKKHGLPAADRYEKQLRELRELIDRPEWPEAVDPALVCVGDEMADRRAAGIFDLLVCEHLRGKKFLDFGCGDGRTVRHARAREARVAVGYDPNAYGFTRHGSIEGFNDKFLEGCTNDLAYVAAQGPYDAILLHDVLDHAAGADPVQILSTVRGLLATKGRVYVRNHPWCGRHGGHCYLQKNKAFLHLIFDEVELARVGGWRREPLQQLTDPLASYRDWFARAGLAVVTELPVRDAVEPFFLAPGLVNDRLRAHFPRPEAMTEALELSFVEYVLEAAAVDLQVF